ncbi:phosphonate metabolism protein PhnM [Thioclava dalianensis]|uniref:Phosphonate metabolism protein PhnM n=1 Tax=Thioclava dalianensis TaxID=1185766 RepID=A0A074U900_9RHOB|nr:alpha-D-ribose 1-methylphosphonate 5-triphosphate diphosphatase [Thioclava dalianensis]KEP71157.1 phosphonate metabolism protein PhnM [Thioclava dalianensis]SFN23742.1 alpha-D-ribose 1-methylphosphonate 5-triphosphate diphosphatase [Thioclava dalianensis]
MSDFILANATLVLPREVMRGALHVVDGQIARIEPGQGVPAGAVDCEGDLVMPGLIELHTDNLERHIEPRPKVNWPHSAAIIAHDAELASVGITTVFDALRVGSIGASSTNRTDYNEYARALASEILAMRDADGLRISHYLHLRAEACSETLIEELAKFGPEDRVGIVSLMDHTPGSRQFRDLEKLRDYVCGKHGLSEADFEDHVASQIALRERLGARHMEAAVAAAGRFGAVLASHDDTTADQVAQSAMQGVQFAEFPTTREAAQACRDQGIAVMMGAPNLIRGGSHSGNVAAHELAEADLLDIVSSDYVPSALLSSALLLGDLWDDLARGVACVTSAPADAVGLSDRGRLELGKRADLIRVRRLNGSGALRGTWVKGVRVG